MPPRGRTWLARQGQVQPTDLNAHIAARIKLRRTTMGLTQAELAGALGVTVAQLQTYERGSTRVSADRLYRLSRCLSVPVEFFFEGLEEPPPVPGSAGEQPAKPPERTSLPPQDPPKGRDTAAVLRAFRRISRPEDRKAMLAFLEKLNSEKP